MTDTALTIPADTLRAALICASTEQARYYINGVYVDPLGYVVSTDGHRAFVAKIDIDGSAITDGWTIPRDALKRALTGYKPAMIEISPARVGDVACQPVDGTFPDWRRVVPATTDGTTAQFNPDYVADMGKIGLLLTGKRKSDSGLTAHLHHNGDGPAGVTFPGAPHAFGVLMPIRTAHTAPDTAWGDAYALIN